MSHPCKRARMALVFEDWKARFVNMAHSDIGFRSEGVSAFRSKAVTMMM